MVRRGRSHRRYRFGVETLLLTTYYLLLTTCYLLLTTYYLLLTTFYFLLTYYLGIDLEWKPRSLCNDGDEGGRAALLQLSSRSTAFVIDLLTLRNLDVAYAALLALVTTFLSCSHILRLGYATPNDIARLEAALPGCGATSTTILDVQLECFEALGRPRGRLPSLQTACAALLEVHIDKACQTSDWEQRPLSSDQIAYAAIDASVLPWLVEAARSRSKLTCSMSPSTAGDTDSVEAVRRAALQTTMLPACRTTAEPRGKQSGEYRLLTKRTVDPRARGGLSTRLVSLKVDEILRTQLGKQMGSRADVVDACAAVGYGGGGCVDDSSQLEVGGGLREEGEGGTTLWHGAASVYVNAGKYRTGPSARYRNRIWKEEVGDLAGDIAGAILLATYYLLPPTYYLLLTTYYLLLTTYCLLLTTSYYYLLLTTTYDLLSGDLAGDLSGDLAGAILLTTHYLLLTTYYLLLTTNYLLPTTYYLLLTTYYLLHYLLLTTH